MTLPIGSLLLLIGVTLVLFTFEWVPVDVMALGILLILILAGLLPPDQAFATFGSDTVMLMLGLLILAAALVRTGVVDIVGQILMRRVGGDSERLLPVIMVAVAAMSAFMSNTAATAFFVPIVMGLAQRARVSASRLLMPLAFAAILASSLTLVSTSTNIVVSGLLTQYKMAPIGMFELTPVGLPIVVLGLIYMLVIGRRLIPERDTPDDLTDEFGLHPYLTEILILPASPLVGKTLGESGFGHNLDVTVLVIIRGERRIYVPQADMHLDQGDILLVEGRRDDIIRIKDTAGIRVNADVALSDPDLQTDETRLVEVIILTRSPVIGRTLRSAGFRERYGLQVLAINRHGETIFRKISQVPIRLGDILLLQGTPETITTLERNNTFRILGTLEDKHPYLKRAPLAILIFVSALLLGSTNLVSLPVAVLLGALAALLTQCITPEEAYRDIEWKVIILIGCMLAFGSAMEYTGTAKYLAGHIVTLLGRNQPLWLLSGFFVLAVLLTQPMSNQAAAVVVLPVAIQTALQLDLNPRTFAMMIALAASTSYITPLEPACLMIYGLGRYRFLDFMKVGSLLTLLVYLISILLVPVIWPLK
jgi:di/tricarboxylate transporter